MEKRQPASARRRQIVEAALRILNEQGVHRLTSAEIAGRVGIADATIFRHFPNKEAIVSAAIDYVEALLFENFPPEHPDPLERLRLFLRMRLAMIREHPAIMQLAYSDRLAEAAGEEGAARMRLIVMRSFAFIRQCLVEAQETGQLAKDVSPEVLVWAVTGVLRGVGAASQMGVIPSQLLDFDAVWANLSRLLPR